MECLGALWFKTDLLCVHDLCAAIQNLYSPRNVINAAVLISETEKECRSRIRARGESRIFLT